MAIVCLEGKQGQGKSVSTVALVFRDWAVKKRKILSNSWLDFPFTRFTLEYFMEHLEDDEIENCTLWLDEMYQLLDSRTAAGKVNKLLTYFIVQCRKRNVDLYVCTHHIDHIDKRLRRAINIRGTCTYDNEDPCQRCQGTGQYPKDNPLDVYQEPLGEGVCGRCLGYGKTGFATVSFFNRDAVDRESRYWSIVIPGPKYWPLYDTSERIGLTGKQKNLTLQDI